MLVTCINGCYRDVPNCSEFATIVDVLVLQAEKVPHESPHNFQHGKYRDKELIVFRHSKIIIKKDLIRPGEAENQILKNGKEVETGGGVDKLIPEKWIASCCVFKEAPVHLDVPDEGETGGDSGRQDIQEEEGVIALSIRIGSIQGGKEHLDEGSAVLARIDQMWETLSCVPVPSDALGKSKPSRQTRD